jgi:hypothetical protein
VGGGGGVMTRGRHGYALCGKGCSLYTFWGRCPEMTFLRGRQRSTDKLLHKELKQVRESKVVVEAGEWDHRGPVTGRRARKYPFVPPYSLRKRVANHNKTRCQGF